MKPVIATVVLMLALFVFPMFPQDIQPPSEAEIGELRQKAEQGDAGFQSDLGRLYEFGWGVTKDYEEAVRWYRLAAEQGNAPAQYSLWVMYYNGEGVPQDRAEAVRWLRLAAEQGHASAQYNLAGMYDDGEGVPLNDQEAVHWYRLAAKQGHASAQNNLAWLYATSENPEVRDPEKALEYAKLAVAEEPSPSGLDTLAEAYFVNGLFQEAIATIRRALSAEPDRKYYQEQLERFERAAREAKDSGR